MSHFTLEPQGPFSLEMIRDFSCGLFTASRACSTSADAVSLAFPLDGTHEIVGVHLERHGSVLEGEVTGTGAIEAVRGQVARILSVDHDARPFERLLRQDPVLARAAAHHPGFRPPIFYSPYAAAGWLVLTQRMRQSQAAAIQQRLAREAGDVVEVRGEVLASFPRPQTVLARSSFAGVPDTKWARLQAVAKAALEGRLEIGRLQALPGAQAREELRGIHGIGPWTADGIWMRGCGLADALIATEPQVHHAVAAAYRLEAVPDDAELEARAEAWRPFRAWVSVLLTMEYYRANGGRAPVDRPRGPSPKPRRQGSLALASER